MIYIVWIALSIAAGMLAENKGRSGIGFFVLSIALSPLVGLIAAAVARPNAAQIELEQLASGGSKRCPHCAEIIKKGAKVCRFCDRDAVDIIADKPEPALAVPAAEQTTAELMSQLGISFDGVRYKYKHYYYANLDDAIAYAQTAQQRLKRSD